MSYDPEPWGLLMSGRTLGSGTKEGFTGKERDAESGLDYFGARLYMAALARWTGVDPLGEKHPEWSPYNYVLNNPIGLFDPDGRQLAPRHALPITPIMMGIWRQAGGRTAAELDAWALNKGVPFLQEVALSHGLGAIAQRLIARLGAWSLRSSSASRAPAAVGQAPPEAAAVAAEARAAESVTGTGAAGEIPETIYRRGGTNPSALTTKLGEEGLSFRSSISNPIPKGKQPVLGGPGDEYISTETAKLPQGSVRVDAEPPGHVTVIGVSPAQVKAASTKQKAFPKDPPKNP